MALLAAHRCRSAIGRHDPDRLRALIWPRPTGYTDGWVAVSQLPRPAARRLRLFGVACARELTHRLTDDDRTALRTSERYADGLASWEQLAAVSRPLSVGPPGVARLVSDSVGWAVVGFYEPHPATDPDNFHVTDPFEAARCAARALAKEAGQRDAFTDARARQAALLRDLVPPPDRTSVPRAWLTSTVVALSQEIYRAGAFDALPVLADALQDAGCEDEPVLAHCRGPGPHARGCWALDAVLGL